MNVKATGNTDYRPNTTLLFFTASEFFKTGISKMKIIERPRKSSNPNYIWEISVAFVNLSFALELILKSFHKKPLKTHSLIDIYDKINQKTKSKIESEFEKIRYDFLYIALGDINPEPPIGRTAQEKIREALTRNKQPFIKFRYLHEMDDQKTVEFDSNTIARLCHAALIIKANQLNIDLDLKQERSK